jgi:hypothetical protein
MLTYFDSCLLTRVICVARMDVGMLLSSCYYLQYAKYIIVCLIVVFVIVIFFLYLHTPFVCMSLRHWTS